MIKKVQLEELNDWMLRTGLTISDLHRTTGVSRNTLSAIRDGNPVRLDSATKLLAALEADGHEIDHLRTNLQRQLNAMKTRAQKQANGPSVVVNNTVERTASRVATDLRNAMERCEIFAAELLARVQAFDREIDEECQRNIQRLRTRIVADLDEIEFVLRNAPPATAP